MKAALLLVAKASLAIVCLIATMTACVARDAEPIVPEGGDSVLPGTIGMVVRSSSEGVVVAVVGTDSPALKAGLRPGDVVLRYNDVLVTNAEQLYRLTLDTPPGTRAVVDVLRGGVPQSFEVPVRQIDTTPRVLRKEQLRTVARIDHRVPLHS